MISLTKTPRVDLRKRPAPASPPRAYVAALAMRYDRTRSPDAKARTLGLRAARARKSALLGF